MENLTAKEEEVMQALWDLKKALVRDIMNKLPNSDQPYTTVASIVRILEKKGFVSHKPYGKTHEYFPLIEKNQYRSFYLKTMISGYFGGSFERLVSFFAKDNDMDIHEMEELLKNVQHDIKDESDE